VASSPSSADQPAPALTLTQWLIVIIAAIGFAFDIYELLMLQLIGQPALRELLNITGPPTPEQRELLLHWRAMIFYIPAIIGGAIGLIGGYLTDKYGRRRVLTFSILLYAFSAFGAGFSTSPQMFLVLRTLTFIGVCLEFVAAVAWLAELFPHPRQREKVLGYTQAFSSFGGLLVAIAFGWIVSTVERAPDTLPTIALPGFLDFFGTIANGQAPWRYTLMSGVIPAIPLILIRPFLPESPAWQAKKDAGTLKRPSFAQLFQGSLRRTTIVTTLMVACGYGVAFGAIQQIPEIVKGLKELPELKAEAIKREVATAAEQGKKARSPNEMSQLIEQKVGQEHTKMQEIGGLIGRFLLAILAVRIVSRQKLIRLFQIPGIFIVPLIFYFMLGVENQTFATINLESIYLGKFPISIVTIGCFLAGLFTVAQFSFWGNYLPRVYPMHLRGTGESVAANVGGRMIGTGFAAVSAMLVASPWFPGGSEPAKFAYAAAMIALLLYGIGLTLSFFLPEPTEEMNDE